MRKHSAGQIDVLLVEDDEEDYLIIKDLLSRLDGVRHEVHWASDYRSALRAADEGDHDVYLVDYRLGGEDGIELVRELVANGHEVPVIVLTGQGNREVDLEATRAGAVDYLVKGEISPALLERAIRYAIQGHANARALRESEDEFVATVSHELRTPLTAIDGWLRVLLDEEAGPLTDDQRRFLTTVERNSNRLMRLVADLLLAGQLEAGRLGLELDDVDLAEVAQETVDLLAGLAADKQIEVMTELEPTVVRGDRVRLLQLLNNLLSNAIKFTPEGGRIDVHAAEHRGTAVLEVRDSGIGIPPEERAHLFERFYRASTGRGIAGTGLGLAISKAIVEAHDGAIRVMDGDGPGTTFIVELPTSARTEVRV